MNPALTLLLLRLATCTTLCLIVTTSERALGVAANLKHKSSVFIFYTKRDEGEMDCPGERISFLCL